MVTGITASIQLPRFQPAKTPVRVPRLNEIMVVRPTSSRVHGRLCLITSDTGLGKCANEVPRSPWNSCFQ